MTAATTGFGARPSRPAIDVVRPVGDDLDQPGAHHPGPDDADDVHLGHAES